MKTVQADFVLKEKKVFSSGCCLLKLFPEDASVKLPPCQPGQFVQVKTDCASVFLRRPISVCYAEGNDLVLFVKPVGPGSRWLTELGEGEKVNIIYPLGKGFSIDNVAGQKVLLVGGGVGCAPLVYLCSILSEKGADISVAVGGRTIGDVKEVIDLYKGSSFVAVSTDDGSMGEKGVITKNSVFEKSFDRIYCCGPEPMMKAVAKIAAEKDIWCEVSLENSMACGIGACLCCVQDTADEGNVCVCKEGPVFNIKRLKSWV